MVKLFFVVFGDKSNFKLYSNSNSVGVTIVSQIKREP